MMAVLIGTSVAGTRGIFALGRDHRLPRVFGRVSGRGRPLVAATLLLVAYVVVVVLNKSWTGLFAQPGIPHYAAIFGWDKLLGDPDPYLLWHSTQADSGYNFSDFRDSDADQLLENGRRATNPAERKILYNQFQDLFTSEVPAVVLYYPRYVVAIATSVNGVNVDTIDTPADRFRGISQWFLQYDEKTATEATQQAQQPAPASTPQIPPAAPPEQTVTTGSAVTGTKKP